MELTRVSADVQDVALFETLNDPIDAFPEAELVRFDNDIGLVWPFIRRRDARETLDLAGLGPGVQPFGIAQGTDLDAGVNVNLEE